MIKRRTHYKRWPHRTLCWRPGPWLFAVHPFFTARPKLCLYPRRGWSLWWLCFEVACVN